jgi:16S rRNA pseudouridine516 synthase
VPIFSLEAWSLVLACHRFHRLAFPVKLDRLLAKHDSMGRTKARALIVAGRVRVDGLPTRRIDHEIDRFTGVELDGSPLRPPERQLHLMLHKPVGILSATSDPVHRTVIDLIDDPDRHTLHLVGRLDRSTSGLILLTNDGNWSKPLMAPETKVPKVYLVETRDPIPSSAIEAFATGFHFPTEDLTTLPAALEILGERQARLTLHEGRYHQIKRMFHRISNRVEKLHRETIGPISLPPDLGPGEWRMLEKEEIARAAGRQSGT